MIQAWDSPPHVKARKWLTHADPQEKAAMLYQLHIVAGGDCTATYFQQEAGLPPWRARYRLRILTERGFITPQTYYGEVYYQLTPAGATLKALLQNWYNGGKARLPRKRRHNQTTQPKITRNRT